jgi:twitching motility protein PilU
MEFKDYLAILVKHNGSDLYLSTHAPPTIRVDEQLRPIDAPLPHGVTKKFAQQIMNEAQRQEFAQNPEMNLALATKQARFRVNIFKQKGEEALVVRQIKLHIPQLSDLGLPTDVLAKVIMKKRGLVLFVGSTGSGKSTSLAALVNYRNENDCCHIVTIEDPMEFVHPHKKSIVDQREVGYDTHSYEEALKNTLRQAPDVILLGEIRTKETMEQAITFAETGHLCLSTLHANNANEAIGRILSFFPQPAKHRILRELSLNMRAIISQRLIQKTTKGLVPAVELLLDSPLVRELIKRGEVHQLKEAMEKSALIGMQTFDMSLYDLYKAGVITYEHALANADSPNNLRLRISLEAGEGNAEQADGQQAESNSDIPPPPPNGLSLERDEDDDKEGFLR